MTVRSRFGAAGTVSLLLHAFIIFGLTFTVPKLQELQNTAPPLAVVLVNAKSQARPQTADALAQHNLDGGSNTDAKQRAQTPLPAITKDTETTELQVALKRVAQLEREARQVLTRAGVQSQVDNSPAKPVPQPVETAPVVDGADLVQRSLAIPRLEAQISKDWNAYQERPRRKFIGALTQEYRFARYVEDWRQKIERIGELNYPQAAREQRIYGTLVATVSIKSNGSLEQAAAAGTTPPSPVTLATPWPTVPAGAVTRARVLRIRPMSKPIPV